MDQDKKSVPRLSLTPDEAAASTGLSRTRIFEAIRAKKLIARKDGKATIIELDELQRYVRSLPAKGRVAPSAGEHVAA
jgi:excisionase family DNA binding protein